jgi:hypothetical protein
MSDRGETDGAVYVYRLLGNGTLKPKQKLEAEGNAPAGSAGDRLGAGLAVENGWLLAGAANGQSFPGLTDPHDEDFRFAGKVYIYRLMGRKWDKVQELTSPYSQGNGAFGGRTDASHIALNEGATLAAIGEPVNRPVFPAEGSVHVFRRENDKAQQVDTWELIQTIPAPSDPHLLSLRSRAACSTIAGASRSSRSTGASSRTW